MDNYEIYMNNFCSMPHKTQIVKRKDTGDYLILSGMEKHSDRKWGSGCQLSYGSAIYFPIILCLYTFAGLILVVPISRLDNRPSE